MLLPIIKHKSNYKKDKWNWKYKNNNSNKLKKCKFNTKLRNSYKYNMIKNITIKDLRQNIKIMREQIIKKTKHQYQAI
jgi:hypothetical protein